MSADEASSTPMSSALSYVVAAGTSANGRSGWQRKRIATERGIAPLANGECMGCAGHTGRSCARECVCKCVGARTPVCERMCRTDLELGDFLLFVLLEEVQVEARKRLAHLIAAVAETIQAPRSARRLKCARA